MRSDNRREAYRTMNAQPAARPVRRRRRRRLTPFGKLVKGLITFVFTVMIILGAMRVQALADTTGFEPPVRMEKVYTSIEIHPGDSLWSIAEDYSNLNSNAEIVKYVKELKHMNHIDDETSLKPGAYLLVYTIQEAR